MREMKTKGADVRKSCIFSYCVRAEPILIINKSSHDFFSVAFLALMVRHYPYPPNKI